MKWSKIGSSVVVLGCLLPLTGCQTYSLGPGSFSQLGGRMIFAVCIDMVVTGISGGATSTNGSRSDISLSGEMAVSKGDIFVTGEIPDGMTGHFDAIEIEAFRDVGMRIFGPEEDFAIGYGQSNNPFSSFELTEGQWLNPDGTVADGPCEQRTY